MQKYLQDYFFVKFNVLDASVTEKFPVSFHVPLYSGPGMKVIVNVDPLKFHVPLKVTVVEVPRWVCVPVAEKYPFVNVKVPVYVSPMPMSPVTCHVPIGVDVFVVGGVVVVSLPPVLLLLLQPPNIKRESPRNKQVVPIKRVNFFLITISFRLIKWCLNK